MRRKCPNCSKYTIRVKDILFGDSRCANCEKLVGANRLAAGLFATLIVIATLLTTFLVFLQMGLFAALVWFSVPVGSLSYIKARFSPLEVKMNVR